MPDVRVLNELQIKKNGVVATYKLGTVNGYYNSTDGKFYEDSSHTVEIEGLPNLVYADIDKNGLYIWKQATSSFVAVSGSGGGLEYVDTLPSPPDIKDAIYGHYSTDNYSETVTQNFLDENEFFVKTGDDYAPKSGIDLIVSDDDVTYKALVSLVLNGTDYDATYDDSTTHTFADGDTFYFKVGGMKFYAGNKDDQRLYLLAGTGGGGGAEYIPGEGIDISNNILSIKPATNSALGGVKPDDETLKVDVTGTLSGNYKGGFNVKIDGNEISTKTFVGTLEEWNNLTSAQKAKFDTVSITDDGTTPIATPGHEVLDSTDTPLPQRTNIQFEGAEATDDDTNDITKITITPYTAGDGIEINNYEVSVTEDRPATFVGTTQEWDALTAAEKAQYKIVNLTNDVAGGEMVVVDAIEDGNLNPVTSNAVYDALIDKAALIRLGCAKNKTYTITVSNKQAPILFMNQRYASTTTSNTPGLIYCFGDQRSALLTIQAFVDFSLTRKGDGTFTAQNSGNTTGALFILTTSNNKITMTEDT